MKLILTIALIITLYHQFDNDTWIFGWAEPQSFSFAIDSEGNCTKYESESRDCTVDEYNLSISLKQITTN